MISLNQNDNDKEKVKTYNSFIFNTDVLYDSDNKSSSYYLMLGKNKEKSKDFKNAINLNYNFSNAVCSAKRKKETKEMHKSISKICKANIDDNLNLFTPIISDFNNNCIPNEKYEDKVILKNLNFFKWIKIN